MKSFPVLIKCQQFIKIMRYAAATYGVNPNLLEPPMSLLRPMEISCLDLRLPKCRLGCKKDEN